MDNWFTKMKYFEKTFAKLRAKKGGKSSKTVENSVDNLKIRA